MTPQILEEYGFTVVGIVARTTNAKAACPDRQNRIAWARFAQQNLAAQIPNKTDTTSLLAVYSDYASDKDGEYSFLIGARVNSTTNVPAGMVTKKVPAGRYAVFTSEKGPLMKVVPGLWQKIWTVPKSEPGGDRAYKADYEVYDARAIDPQNAQVEIHVGIR